MLCGFVQAGGRSSLQAQLMPGISPWWGEPAEKGSTKHGRVFTHLPRALLRLPRLSLCEKALAEYLDMKRLAFPRFYFISSADLLDILSNGTNPQLVRLVLHFQECHSGRCCPGTLLSVLSGGIFSHPMWITTPSADLHLPSLTGSPALGVV